ncbi:MAG: hypothetical protein OEY99_03520, partial [Aigarchaeota archaeon]|nr:hypothetical protein [Aigarchaeota archaeon]
MKKHGIKAFLVLIAIAFAFVGVVAAEEAQGTAASEKVVVAIDLFHSPAGADVDQIVGNMTLREPRIEFKMLTATEDFTASALSDVTMVILGNNNG